MNLEEMLAQFRMLHAKTTQHERVTVEALVDMGLALSEIREAAGDEWRRHLPRVVISDADVAYLIEFAVRYCDTALSDDAVSEAFAAAAKHFNHFGGREAGTLRRPRRQ